MGLKTAGATLCFRGGLLSGTVHVALHTAEPEAANELAGNGYARVAVGEADWTIDGASGEASNANRIAFPTPTAAWADPTHVALWDAAGAGNLLAAIALTNDVAPPPAGIEVSFPIGTLTLALATD